MENAIIDNLNAERMRSMEVTIRELERITANSNVHKSFFEHHVFLVKI